MKASPEHFNNFEVSIDMNWINIPLFAWEPFAWDYYWYLPLLVLYFAHCAPGGATYCAVASLALLDAVDSTLPSDSQERLRRWCVEKQISGFQSRTNKDANTSYSFWLGASLQVRAQTIIWFTIKP